MPLGTGLAGHVANTGVTLLIPDCYQDARFDKTWDRKTGYRTRSMLLMPLDNSQGDRLGVFQVINKHNGAAFDYQDLTYLKAIAASAAIALENAQLYEAQRDSFVSLVTAPRQYRGCTGPGNERTFTARCRFIGNPRAEAGPGGR